MIFNVSKAEGGGYTAKAVNESIFTEANTLDELKVNINEAVACHFDDSLYTIEISLQD